MHIVEIVTIGSCPDLANLLGEFPLASPAFMYEDPTASPYYADAATTHPNVAPTSMTIPGTLEQWREWTGLPFDASGPVHVPGALVPVMCAAEHDVAVYVEPNVWVHHHLGR